MLKKTHLAIGLASSLVFLSSVNNEIVFLIVVLISSLLPDLDHGFSKIKGIGFFGSGSNPRKILHTYTFCIIVTLFLAFFYPLLALPFFVGYSFHLFADSFTTNGIRPLWPLKYVSRGVIKNGGKIENSVFVTFALIDIVLIIINLFRIF